MSATENLRVYNQPAVTAHYGTLNYLSACESFLSEKYIPRGAEILDLGVGGGRTTPYLSSIASRYLGVDDSEEMIRTCRKKFPDLEFRVGDAADLSSLADSSFGAVVIAFHGLDYVIPEERRRQSLRECLRILKSNSVLIFSSHNPASFWSGRRGARSACARLPANGPANEGPVSLPPF